MKKPLVPLVKISGDSSIYFDFEKHVPYIQNFGGRFTEAGDAKSYSYLNTFGLYYLLMLLVGVSGTILNHFIVIPTLFGIIFALLLGIALGKIVIKIMIVNYMKEREYVTLTKKEVRKVVDNKKNSNFKDNGNFNDFRVMFSNYYIFIKGTSEWKRFYNVCCRFSWNDTDC